MTVLSHISFTCSFSITGIGWCSYHLSPHSRPYLLLSFQWTLHATLSWRFLHSFCPRLEQPLCTTRSPSFHCTVRLRAVSFLLENLRRTRESRASGEAARRARGGRRAKKDARLPPRARLAASSLVRDFSARTRLSCPAQIFGFSSKNWETARSLLHSLHKGESFVLSMWHLTELVLKACSCAAQINPSVYFFKSDPLRSHFQYSSTAISSVSLTNTPCKGLPSLPGLPVSSWVPSLRTTFLIILQRLCHLNDHFLLPGSL